MDLLFDPKVCPKNKFAKQFCNVKFVRLCIFSVPNFKGCVVI